MDIRRIAANLAAELQRKYWLLRLRIAERDQDKHLAHCAAVIRRMCGRAAGPHLKTLYDGRVLVLPLIGEVISPHKSREDLTVAEIKLVLFEFLRRRVCGNSAVLPA